MDGGDFSLKQWMNEWMNKWMKIFKTINEWMNELRYFKTYSRGNGWIDEYTNVCMLDECILACLQSQTSTMMLLMFIHYLSVLQNNTIQCSSLDFGLTYAALISAIHRISKLQDFS